MHQSICDYVLDLVENAIESGASWIRVTLWKRNNRMSMLIRDDGRGMTAQEMNRATDPFFSDAMAKHPERKVGLGLAFAAQTAEAIGGKLSLHSTPRVGTVVGLRFPLDHVDCPPVGNDLPSTLAALFGFPGSYELDLQRTGAGDGYRVKRSELVEVLGSIDDVGARVLVRDYLESCENDLRWGECDGEDEPGGAAEAPRKQTA